MRTVSCTLFLLFPLLVLSQQWHHDFSRAQEQARQEQKPIVLVFSGSDWCAPCRKLDRDIWQSETFKAYAAKHYVLYKADFPRKKKNKLAPETAAANAKLAERFNPKGHFPLVVLLDASNTVYAEMGYQRGSSQEYLDLLNSYLQ